MALGRQLTAVDRADDSACAEVADVGHLLRGQQCVRAHRGRGELDRPQQIETELCAELAQIEPALGRERPQSNEDIDGRGAGGPARPRPAAAAEAGSRTTGRGRFGLSQALINPLQGRRRSEL
jgi:hypothetical protein